MTRYIRKCNEKEVKKIGDYAGYSEGAVISRALVQRDTFTFTFFSFSENEGISPYSMDGDTLIHVIEGKVEVGIEGDAPVNLSAGEVFAIESDVLFGIEPLTAAKIIMYCFR